MLNIQQFAQVTDLVDLISSENFLLDEVIIHLLQKADVSDLINFFRPDYKVYCFTEFDKNNIFLLNKFILNEHKEKAVLISYQDFIDYDYLSLCAKDNAVKRNMILTLQDSINLDNIAKTLVDFGYEKVNSTYDKFSFAIRGDILDISMNDDVGYRISIDGDKIEKITTFQIDNQTSHSKKIDSIGIFATVL